jgi:hypothetical protein
MVQLGYGMENILTPMQNHVPSALGALCKWYSFHTDKATWIYLHEKPAPTRIFPCLSAATHLGTALKGKKKKKKKKVLPKTEDQIT